VKGRVPSPSAVGIDLGTTHVVVAARSEIAGVAGAAETVLFPIPQRVAVGTIAAEPLLPAALSPEADGDGEATWIAGVWARKRATEVDGKTIVSPKSWLSYAGVDREAPILPWGGTGAKLSPVDAQVALLKHVHDAWDAAHPEAPLTALPVVVTIPASFDETARQLTLRALAAAELPHARLLEEPQAAFLAVAPEARPTAGRLLVVDVGGGTTDLSLLAIGDGSAERIAVGPHLLLGGDNFDLALAAVCEGRFPLQEADGTRRRLDAGRFAALVAACRSAKETLLTPGGADVFEVAIADRGSNLFGTILRAQWTAAAVEALILERFFPEDVAERPSPPRAGLAHVGLPYERDGAITRHIARFLRSYGPVDALLFAGGVFEAPALRARVQAVVEQVQNAPVSVVQNAGNFEAVAKGAALYATPAGMEQLRATTARAYYLQVATNEARLILPRGAAVGEPHTLAASVEARLGTPSRFVLLANDGEEERHVPDEKDVRLSMVTTLPRSLAGPNTTAKGVPVTVVAALTAVGTIAVSLGHGDESFALTFETSQEKSFEVADPSNVFSDADDADLRALIHASFGPKSAEQARSKEILRDLEKRFGPRKSWSAALGRALVDALLPRAQHRRQTPELERLYLLLLGFGLRPGAGFPGDELRVERTLPFFRERLAFPDKTAVQQAYFIALRRVAAGLSSTAQEQLFSQWEAPKKKGPVLLARDEARSALVAFEELPLAAKRLLGARLVERCLVDGNPALWGDLGRLGARTPLIAGAEHAVPSEIAEAWLSDLLRVPWQLSSVNAVLSMARLTGDRTRDLRERMRRDVAKKLEKLGVPAADCAPLFEVVAVAPRERLLAFGDDLPLGLALRA